MTDRQALVDKVVTTCRTCQLTSASQSRLTLVTVARETYGPGEHLYMDIGTIGLRGDPETQFLVIVDGYGRVLRLHR